MSNPFLGEIRMFGGNFQPLGWAFCNGQLLAISQNDALFALLGTTYGGDGVTTFGVPDLRGRIPVHAGQGPGLSNRNLGEFAGTEEVVLTTPNLPVHSHGLATTAQAGTTNIPGTGVILADQGPAGSTQTPVYIPASPPPTPVGMHPNSTGLSGTNAPHDNMQPYLAVNYIIALQGVFPSRN